MEENKDKINDDDKEEIYRYRLKKQPLRSEREEIKSKRIKKVYQVIIILIVLVIGFECGLLLGTAKSKTIKPQTAMDSAKFDEIAYYFENYWLYGDDYEDLDAILYDKALYGMTTFSDDPYTTYASKSDMDEYNSELNGQFVGIGVTYRAAASGFVITNVYEDSPAAKAGLESGDLIMSVNGQSCFEMETTDLQDIVLGEDNTALKMTILRDGQSEDIEVIRGDVDSSVYAYVYADTPILEIYSFGLDTYDDCVTYLEQYKGYDSLVIDLRDNGGGYAQAVEKIAGLFLPKGAVVMREYDKNGNELVSVASSDVHYDNFKNIIILTNNNTASASEVLALSLIEGHENAKSIGTTTYGKGVVQSLLTLSDGSTLKITSLYWTSDRGTSIHESGIEPYEEVLMDDIFYEVYYPLLSDLTFESDSVSEYVRLVEEALRFIGYDVARTDGYFDESLTLALSQFAKDHGLAQDGIIDQTIYDAIVSVMYKKAYGDIQSDAQLMRALEVLNG